MSAGYVVKKWLDADPHSRNLELHRRVREDGYSGHKTAFYTPVAGLRPAQPSVIPSVRVDASSASSCAQRELGLRAWGA